MAGSQGYSGAAILSSWAALKGGAGIVRLLYPYQMSYELVNAPYELIKTASDFHDPETLLNHMNAATSVFVGPGLGRSAEVGELLRKIVPDIEKPVVLDADALYHYAEEPYSLPGRCIMTPHRGEMARLLHEPPPKVISREYLQRCQQFVEEKGVTLVLKGGPTFILHPGQVIHICSKGDPGMATAGSGDVLTGLIAALLAQGLSTHDAACLGVFIHGVAGEHAADLLTPYCMTATDIIAHFPEGFVMEEI